MRYIRDASLQEVLDASQWPDETRKLLSDFPVPKLYEFDKFDVGDVVVTVHHPARDTDGPVREVFENWRTWLTYPCSEARGDRDNHFRLLDVLTRGKPFTTSPIIDERPRYHDGRHRLLAFYDFARDPAVERTVEVYRLEREKARRN